VTENNQDQPSLVGPPRPGNDAYTNPRLSLQRMDLFLIRLGILNAFQHSSVLLRGNLLDVGSGNQPYRDLLLTHKGVTSYTALDLADNGHYAPGDVSWDGVRMPFEEQSFDSVVATEVLEHCPDPLVTLREIYRVLKPSGLFFFTVPFLWPLHDAPNDEFRYTPWSLERLLRQAGFSDIHLWPTGGWNAALAQSIGLWVRRAPMNERLRAALSLVALPVVWLLAKTDRPVKQFHHGFYLMPGIAGTARAQADCLC
jgi:SAM-dependent methyltransferase